MLPLDTAHLRLRYTGATGTIGASCLRLSIEMGMRVTLLNRRRNASERTLPDAVASR